MNLNTMKKWNYKTAWQFFKQTELQQCLEYINSLGIRKETIDLRKDYSKAREKIMKEIDSNTLVVIDGGSVNGKSTLAKRIANLTDSLIIDIDLLCVQELKQKLKNVKNEKEYKYIINNIDKIMDDYLLNNLEREVYEQSKKGKSVILVGSFINLISRAIVVRTLGKYFNRIISLVCCENTFQQVEKLIKKREVEVGGMAQYIKQKAYEEYVGMLRIINMKNGIFLGLGMDSSFIVNTKVSDTFV